MLRICVCIQQSAAESTTASSASATVGNTHAHGGALLPASRGESEGGKGGEGGEGVSTCSCEPSVSVAAVDGQTSAAGRSRASSRNLPR